MSNLIPNNQSSIVAIILSGGAGRRFGGLDKGLQNYKNKPLIEHVIDALQGQVNSFILCVNRNQESYLKYGCALVEDIEHRAARVEGASHDGVSFEGASFNGASFNGPMAGVNAAADFIENSGLGETASHVLLCSCDSPALPENYVSRLLEQLSGSGKSVAVVNDGERRQNLHSLIKIAALPSLAKYYSAGGRAMHRWYQEIGVVDVDFSDRPEAFLNINSPEQLKQRIT
ncbi:MAG: molybdopterin-guanine dinucleotide biosynthesis protein A [Arenicella sp.]|jgi:molybdopterin-guanine dinucleotide biosynthesis protein A